jgi:hypothetical protein
MPNDIIINAHKSLIKNGYEVPKNVNDFESELSSNPDMVKDLHTSFVKMGYEVPEYEEFSKSLALKKKEETTSENSSTPASSPLQPSKTSGEIPSNIVEATTKTPVMIGRGAGGKPVYEGEKSGKTYSVEDQIKNKPQDNYIKEGVNIPIPKELEQSIKTSKEVAEQDRLAKIKEDEAYNKIAESLPFSIKAKTVGSSIVKGAIEVLPTIMDVYANATGSALDKADVLKVRDFLDETFKEDDRYKKTTVNAIARNVATAGAMMATGGAGAAAQGAVMAGNESFNDAISNGASKSTATKAAVINMLGGAALESIPVFRALNRVGAKTGSNIYKNIWDASKNTVKGGVEEAITGGLQQTLSNATANVMYDSTRDISDNVFNSGMDEGTAGFILNGLLNTLALKRGKTTIKSEIAKIDNAIKYATETKRAVLEKFKKNGQVPIPQSAERQTVDTTGTEQGVIKTEGQAPDNRGANQQNNQVENVQPIPQQGSSEAISNEPSVSGGIEPSGTNRNEANVVDENNTTKQTNITDLHIDNLIESGGADLAIEDITRNAKLLSEEIIKSNTNGSPNTSNTTQEGQNNGSGIPTGNEGNPAIPKGDERAKADLGKTKVLINDIVSKWNSAQELQGTEKTQAMRDYKESVNSDPKIKRIFENLNAINKALGVEKSSVKCP